jgi:DNA-binding NarL/FixJ family response regulator
MVVDGSPASLSTLESCLACEEDFETVGLALSSFDALARVHGLRPDLILLNLQMPDMNGLEAAMHFRRKSPSARVVILTDRLRPEADLRRACESSGATGPLTKTQPHQDLLSEIRLLLAARS